MENVIRYYENYDEDGRLERDNAHRLEFITSTYLLEQLIASREKILDLGAATGRYSLYYAQKGHPVTAVELVQKNIEIMQENVQKLSATTPEIADNLSIYQGDARDLSRFADGSFDVVLCFGPLYHLPSIADKRKCLAESVRVLKSGGILAVAYIGKYAVFVNESRDAVEQAQWDELHDVLAKGVGDGPFCFNSPEEIEQLMSEFPLVKRKHAGTDGIGYLISDQLATMDDNHFRMWLNYHFSTCENPHLLGYSLHGLYIGEKR